MRNPSPLPGIVLILAIVTAGCLQSTTLTAQEIAGTNAEGKAEAETTGKRVDARDEAALREHLGRKVTVFGVIKRARDWDGGANFLNFEGGKFMLICFESEYANFPDGRPATTLRDKNVEATGYISEYKGRLQIKLTHPGQIKIIKPKAKENPEGNKSEEATKKKPLAKPEPKPEKVDPKKYFCQ